MKIRELGLVDAIAIDSAQHGHVSSSSSDRSAWADFFSRSGNRAWGSFVEDKLIGTVFLQPDPLQPTHVTLRGLWIDEAHRGCGYAHELIDAALEYADAECYRMVKLWVSELNTSAVSLYRSMDFVPTGRLRPSAHDPFHHLQQYVLDLHQPLSVQV